MLVQDLNLHHCALRYFFIVRLALNDEKSDCTVDTIDGV